MIGSTPSWIVAFAALSIVIWHSPIGMSTAMKVR
jgi:hypothetical protein